MGEVCRASDTGISSRPHACKPLTGSRCSGLVLPCERGSTKRYEIIHSNNTSYHTIMTNRPSMLNSSTVVKFRNILLGWYSSTLRSPMWINREDMSHSSLQSADSRTGFKTVSKNWLYKLHYFAALISLKHIATAVTRWSLKPLTRKRKIEMECNLREKC